MIRLALFICILQTAPILAQDAELAVKEIAKTEFVSLKPPLTRAPLMSGLGRSEWSLVYDKALEPVGPVGREHFALWTDSKGSVHVYGGLGYEPNQFTPLSDHWSLSINGGGWIENQQSNEPKAYQTPNDTGWVLVEGESPVGGGIQRAEMPEPDSQLLYRELATVWNDKTGAYEYRLAVDRLLKLNTKDGVTTWTPVTGGSPFSQLASFVYDQANDQYLVFCGIYALEEKGVDCSAVFRFKFTNAEKTEGVWSVLNNQGALTPPGRYGAASVYDEVNKRTVVFGGASEGCANAAENPVCPLNDVWTLETSGDSYSWKKLDIPSPEGGRNGCWAYEPNGNRMFLLGRTPDAKTSVKGLAVLNLKAGEEKWEAFDLPSQVIERSSCRATYDKTKDRILFGFGNSGKIYTDLWSLDLNP